MTYAINSKNRMNQMNVKRMSMIKQPHDFKSFFTENKIESKAPETW